MAEFPHLFLRIFKLFFSLDRLASPPWGVEILLVDSCYSCVILNKMQYAVPRQIKPGILTLNIKRGQSNFRTVSFFVSCKEKGYCRVVSLRQLSFDCRSYGGRSRRMQGGLRCIGYK